MRFHDPQRPKLQLGQPCWAQAPQVALPGLHVTPLMTSCCSQLEVEVMLNGSYRQIVESADGLERLFRSWANDPEATLKEYWHLEPPQGQGKLAEPTGPNIEVGKSTEELDL